ncbi:hypothetical protein F0L68_33225 [Solihabitans fulvus]|uniref:Uncharacterized protein n=1 Tax=Solihabitans fulvus TaxID=1892852 RepID=A0A5B2WQN9_9PSEU|nr:hypothetical protein [Solihabitans fulvus]KAA2253278.1 hypothetical protein F0L68_33225 [Solihabitans fulvus]
MSTPDYSPDGLTVEDITALQQEFTEELRREGHLPPPRRHRPRRSGTWPRGARGPSAPTSRRPATGPDHKRGEDQ